MTEHAEAIWGRKSPKMIMKEARRRFGILKNDTEFRGTAGPYVALASAHYSLVKRYLEHWWQKPLAVWHTWCAVARVMTAYRLGLEDANQADVVSRILLKAPKWLGGNIMLAETIASNYQYEGDTPHTCALLMVTLAECKMAQGNYAMANISMDHALQFERAILAEPDQLMAQRQLCRILASAGVFACEHGYLIDWAKGMRLLERAHEIALLASTDQTLKIEAEINRMNQLKTVRVGTNH